MEVRFGIWGAGAIAEQVVRDMPLAVGVRAHAVASRSLESAHTFARRHGIARCGVGLGFLLGDPEVDVIYIATPHSRHAEDSIACLESGKAVLCEKPFTVNAAQARAVIETARQRNLFCMEAMWTRFIPAVIDAGRRVKQGDIGRVRLVQGSFAYASRFDSTHRLFDRSQAGGALLDRGVYLVSLLQHWLGTPDAVRGAAVLGETGVDEHDSVTLSWGEATVAVASMAVSLRARGDNDVLLLGERGALRLCAPFYRAHRVEIRPAAEQAVIASSDELAQGWKTKLRQLPALQALRRRMNWTETSGPCRVLRYPFKGNGYQFELDEVARCLRLGLAESPIMPLRESVAVMETLDALRRQWGLIYPNE